MTFLEAGKSEEPSITIYNEVNGIIFDKGGDGTEYMERISKEAKRIYILCCFEGEVLNGGFGSFFFNSAGNYTYDVLEALSFFEAESYLSCIQKAMSWFPDAKPSIKREA